MQFGTVTGRFLAAVADRPTDPDVNPDLVPVSGTVRFTPSASSLVSTADSAIVLPAPIVAVFDNEGYLSLNGVRGVSLVATDSTGINPTNFTYTVSFTDLKFDTIPLTYKSFSMKLPAGTTVDLSTVTPVGSSNGVTVVQGPKGEPGAPGGTFAYNGTDAFASGTGSDPLIPSIDPATFLPSGRSLAAWDGRWRGGAIRGNPSKKYVEVSGVVRPDTTGNWFQISDSVHSPINVDSVTSNGSTVSINFASIAATKVVSFVAAPDESFIREFGLLTGASVTTSQAQLSLEAVFPVTTAYIAWNGSAWTSSNPACSATFANGKLTVTQQAAIPASLQYDFNVVPRGGTYTTNVTADAGALTATTLTIEFRDRAGALVTTPTTDMKLFVTRGGGRYQLPPNSVLGSAYPLVNIWFRGVFEV